ncbi:MAG TPA: class I SAM-dependent methyltransferase [Opitutaceae bacterium]|nr:class I SAM-dependent methyltransferase [Opitutaceae bacterium]
MNAATSALGPDQAAEAWDDVVDAYEEGLEPFTNAFAATALDLGGVNTRARILDVGTGPGGLALAALARGAEVTAIDFAPRMVRRLRERLSGEQRWRTQALVMDGQELELPDATFDAAFSIFGLIFFPDPAQGLSELARVLKPGGRAVVAAWSSPQRHEALQLITQVLGSVWPEFRPPSPPPPWLCFADPEVFHCALFEAGFASATIHTVTKAWEIESADWFVRQVPHLSPGTNYLFESMGPEIATAFGAALRARLQERFGNGPVRFRAEAHLGVARKG